MTKALLLAAALVQQPAPLEIGPDGRLPATVNGTPVTLFSAPGMPSSVYLSQALATRLFGPDEAKISDRKAFGLISVGPPVIAKIGPITVGGKAKVAELAVAGATDRLQMHWHRTDAYPFGEALAGPYALPQPVIRYRLADPRPGETDTIVPLAGRSSWWIASTKVEVGGETLLFAFAPHFPHTVMSAAAGRVLAAAQGGSMSGEAVQTLISHGVTRPARLLTFARPFTLGALSIKTAMVRTRDYGSTGSIPDADAFDPSEDDILVTAKRKGSKPLYVVYLGADALQGCSALTYDKPAKTVTMTCASS